MVEIIPKKTKTRLKKTTTIAAMIIIATIIASPLAVSKHASAPVVIPLIKGF